MRPPQKCLHRGCPRRTTGTYCDVHAAEHGGRGPNGYKPTYSSAAWKRARAAARERDGDACVVCGSTEFIAVHHLNGNSNDMRLENLVTLCRRHHHREHH
jgi:5-methylcytosine-specific restriction endonuclease McrA